MSDLSNVRSMLEAAEAAANAGDLAVADDLLRRAAHLQEAELGPVHPDLANTLNNLAIVAETTGRIEDAEMFYRRAVAITSTSLSPEDPRVASSRKNLEDFCRDRGVPVEVTPVAVPSPEPAPPQPTFPEPDKGVHDEDARLVKDTAAPNRSVAIVAIAVVALVVVTFVATRQRSPRQPPASAVPSAPLPQGNESTRAAAPAPIESRPTTTSRDDKGGNVAISSSATGRASAGSSLVTSQLCRTLSTGDNWRCDPAGPSVPPGALVFYTRVTSARDATLIHRWYRGDTLRKTARLRIAANTTEGYRTYSRQTVRSGEDWRVEARNAAGDLLYEQRVSVR